MIESIKGEMLSMKYSLAQVNEVVSAAKVEVSLASSLSIDAGESSFGLTANQSSLSLAASAVSNGAIKGLSKPNLPEDAGILFRLGTATRPEQMGLATIIKGQTKGLANIKSKGKVAGLTPKVISEATTSLATSALNSGSKSGLISESNASVMVQSLAQNIFGNLKGTSLELDAEKIIPSFSSSLSGLKSLNLSKEGIVLATQSMVAESIAGIKTNALESSASEMLPMIIQNSITGSYAAVSNLDSFSSATAAVAKSALAAADDIGLINSAAEGASIASVIFSSTMDSMDQIPDWNVEQLTTVALKVQESAVEAISDLGMTGNEAASILVEATVSMVESMGTLDRFDDLVLDKTTLNQSFNQITAATTDDLKTSFDGVTNNYDSVLGSAVEQASTTASTVEPDVTNPSAPLPIGIPTGIARISPTLPRANIALAMFQINSAGVGNTIKFYADAACTAYLGEGVFTSTTIPISFSLAVSDQYHFYVKEFSSTGATSACADTGETYHYDLTTPVPMASLSSPALPFGSTNIVVLQVSDLELGGTIEIYSDNACSSLLGSQVVSMPVQMVTAVLGANGIYNFYLKQTDDLGNSSTCQSSGISYNFDSTPPSSVVLTLFSPSTSPSTIASPVFRITGTEAGANVGIYSSPSCSVPSLKSSTTGNAGSTDVAVSGLSQGANALYAQQRDAAGNLSMCSSAFIYELDTLAPAAPMVSLSMGQQPVTALSSVNLNVTVSEPSGTLKFYSDNTCGTFIQAFAVTVLTQDYTITGQTEGVHTYYTRHGDSLNNFSACSASFATWTSDLTPPAMPILTGTAPAGPSAATSISITGAAEANSQIQIYTSGSCTASVGSGFTNGSGNFAVAYSIPTLDTAYVFYAKAFDASGNSSACSATNASYSHSSSIPSVISITSAYNGTLTVGNTLDVNIHFSEPVTVTGSPLLQLGLGSPGKYASYLSGSGSAVLSFRYTIATNDNSPDLDYFDSNSLILNAGTILDLTLVPAQLNLPALGGIGSLSYNQNIIVDTMSPVISGISNQNIAEDSIISNLPLTVHDNGNFISCSSVMVSSSNPSLIPHANISVFGTAPSCLLSVTPLMNESGSSTITLTATDGINTDTILNFVVNVAPVNDAPSLSAISNQITSEDTPINGIPVMINDIDSALVCATSLSASSSDSLLLPNANISFAGTVPNCTVSLNPAINQSGPVSISVTVSDGMLSSVQPFMLTINSVNDAPTITDVPNQAVNEDSNLSNIPIFISDIDNSLVCNAALSAASTNPGLLPIGNVIFGGTAPNCTMTLIPILDQNGSTTVTLTLTDGSLVSNDTFTLNVNPINDLPYISPFSNALVVMGPNLFNIPFTISDIDSSVNCSPANISITSMNSGVISPAAFSVTGSGGACMLNINPAGANKGNSLITVVINDMNGGTSQSQFDLKVVADWVGEAYIKAANVSSPALFGMSLSLFGDTLAVGSPSESSNQTTITNGPSASNNTMAANAGAVYVYKRSGPTWIQEAYVKASNAAADDNFGVEVSLSGESLAVSAPQEDGSLTTITNGTTSDSTNTASASGAVYVYKRSGLNWAQEAFIKASNSNAGDLFGSSVALDGDTLIVGAKMEASSQTVITNGSTSSTNNTIAGAGATYVYGRSGVTWTQQAYIKAANAQGNDNFGDRVALSGNTIAVGAWAEASNDTTITNGTTASADNSATASGAVYIYRKNGTTWNQEAFIKAKNSQASDFFGAGLAIAGDTLAVGAGGESSSQTTITNGPTFTNVEGRTSSGTIYIYRRNGVIWNHESYIKASNSTANNMLGERLSLSANMLAVGAYLDDSNQNTITNGPSASTNTSMTNSGAAYIFKRDGNLWGQIAYIKAVNANVEDQFGTAVSLSNDTLAVGAPMEDSNQNFITNGPGGSADNSMVDSGATYIFRNVDRMVDPHFIVSSKTTTSVTFTWTPNLGNTNQVKIAPAAAGSGIPLPCSDPGAITVSPGATTYTYSGLTPLTQYGFRICAFDGMGSTQGSVIWDSTL